MFEWLVLNSKKVLLFSLLLTLGAFYSFQFLSFNHDFEQYFPQEKDSYGRYVNYLKTFHQQDNWFVVAPQTNPNGVFDSTYQAQLNDYVSKLRLLPGIGKVENPLSLQLPVYTPFGWQTQSIFHNNKPKDSLKLYLKHSPELYGRVIARDFSSLLIRVELKTNFPADSNAILFKAFTELNQSSAFKKVVLGGRFPSEQVYISYLQSETILFASLSALLIIVVLYMMYGTIKAVLIPFIAVLLSVVWTIGLMTSTGKSLDLLTVMLPPILFVITISDLTHLYSRYLEEKRLESSNKKALLLALKEVGPATFITAFTTAAGFISFLSSPIFPIKQFGIYACAGVFISYFIAYFIFPSVLIHSSNANYPNTKKVVHSNYWEMQLLPKVLKFGMRNYSYILLSTFILLGLGVFGVFHLRLNSYLLDDVPQKSHIKEDMWYIEKNYSGVRSLDISYTFQRGTVWDYNNVLTASNIHDLIEKEYQSDQVNSFVSILKSLHKGRNNNVVGSYILPEHIDSLQWCIKELKKVRKRKEVKSIISEDGKTIRFFGTVADRGSLYYNKVNERLLAQVHKNYSSNGKILITGGSQLLDENTNTLTNDLALDLLIGIFVIAVLMAMLFKKLKMVFIALIPNILPLLFTAGLMYFLKIDLNPSNALIFSIAFGIAVDDSIHFLARYRYESKNHQNLKAIYITYISTGKAMIFTALVVISGFVCLLFSSFQSIFYMGLLVSSTLVFAIFCDMLLLPGLLYFVNRK